jgi:hypothetical protein
MPEVDTTTAEIEGTTDQDWAGGSSVQTSVRDPDLPSSLDNKRQNASR